MNEVMVIARKDIKETLRNKAFYFSIGLTFFIIVMLTGAIRDNIIALAQQGLSAAETISSIQPLMGTAVYLLAFMIMMLFSMYMNGYAVVMEKMKRSMESLLCTPLTMKQVWLGKSLAVFIPSAVLGLAFAFGSVCIIDVLFVVPVVGHWVMPGPAPLVATLLAVPSVVLLLSSVATMLQLITANIRLINLAFMAVIFGVGFGLSSSLRMAASSWGVVYVSFGIAAGLVLLVALLSRHVTKERVVLSSKG